MTISLIIPYYNEEQNILKTLNLIKAQSLLPNEVLLINSSSSDKTSEIINEFSKNNTELNIRNLFANTKNPSDSKNYGILNSKNDFLAFMDCGIFFPENWLLECMRSNNEKDFDIISAPIKFSAKNTFDASAIAQLWGYNSRHFVIPGSIIKKKIFEKYGLFENRRAGYDLVWKNKIKKNSVSVLMLKNISIRYDGYNVAENFKKLFLKIFLYSTKSAKLRGYHKDKIYIFLSIIFFILFFLNKNLGIYLIITYFLIRQIIFPIYKSKSIQVFIDYPFSLLTIFFVGLVIDLSRVMGYFKSYFYTK